jgi:hypothetical protein
MQNNEVTLQVLAIDSCEDGVTQIVHDHRNQYVYPYLESRGFRLVYRQEQAVLRENVESAARRDDIAYITGSAHGSDTACFGYDSLPIFEVGNYQPEEVDGKVVHLLSCETGTKLGPDFVKNGCRAYFGYRGNFTFRLESHLIDIFLECDSEIDLAFADGLTAEEVHDRVVTLYEQRISELDEAGEIDAASMLKENLEYLCTPSVYGDKQACILDSST